MGHATIMTAARQKILAHLKKTRSATAREIARALNMSAPNTRHHLSVLRSDGRIEMVETRRREARGRPEKLYTLSQAALGDNLAALADALLNVERSTFHVERTASQMLDPAPFKNLPAAKRLALLVDKLNSMRYQARWEAGAEGPRIIFARCPYAKIIEKHPELCRMDAEIVRSALETNVEQTAKIEKMRGVCAFATR